MLKRSDIVGLLGFIMMVAGAVFFFYSEALLPLYWLLGTLGWFSGFGIFLGWTFWRAGTLSAFHHKA